MLGFNAFSAQPFGAIGTVFLGVSTQSLNFTETSAAIKIGVSSAEMSGIASKQSVGVGILAGIADISGNFTETSNAIKVATGVSDINFNNTQTSSALRLRLGTSSQSSNLLKQAMLLK